MAVTFHHAELPNGLTIIAEADPDAHSAAAGFFVRTGARDEPDEIMGVSHFLEHMMFKGTDGLTADDINRAFDEIGARNNAYTSSELTAFHAHVLPEHLPRAVELLAMLLRPALREEDFTTEKGVILEEIAMYKDNPFWVLYEEAVDRHYRPHPLSHRVLGTRETITGLEREAMRAYFESRYSADNTVLALAGRVDFSAMHDLAGRLCGGWARTGAGRDASTPRTGGGEFTLRDAKVTRGYIIGIAEGPPIDDDRRYAASLAAQILGAADNSRLHWALVETGLAEQAEASYDAHEGVGECFVFAACDPDRCDEVWGIITREIDNLRDSITDDDLMRLRSKMATGVTLHGERPADRMHRIGRRWTHLRQHRTLEEELDRINRVTLSDVREVIDAYPLAPTTVGRLLPRT